MTGRLLEVLVQFHGKGVDPGTLEDRITTSVADAVHAAGLHGVSLIMQWSDATALELRPRIVPRTPDQARTDAPDSPDAIEAALIEAERLAAVGRRRNRWNFLTHRSIARRLDAVDATNANSRRQLEQLRHLEALDAAAAPDIGRPGWRLVSVDDPPTWANDLASPPNT